MSYNSHTTTWYTSATCYTSTTWYNIYWIPTNQHIFNIEILLTQPVSEAYPPTVILALIILL